MQYIDRMLELLRDSKWHSLDEIKNEIPVSADQLNEILSFLQDQSFINRDNEKLRITQRGLRFLTLPV